MKYQALTDRVEDRAMFVDPEHGVKDNGAYERGDGSESKVEPLAPSYKVGGGPGGIQNANATVSREEWRPVGRMQNMTTGGSTDDGGIFGKSGLASVPNVHLMFIMGFLFSVRGS